ncbi:MAG TPA: PrsW family intramembrane metalloprotease [Candidatus Saccharimonadales bacterium]|nr:PrsW family intramembrane metalloprotease [Candidatus Saccharimonadales bacterium]
MATTLAMYFVRHDRGAREPIKALWMAFGLGAIGALMAGLLEFWLISAHSVTPTTTRSSLFATFLLVGVIEECCKFLPAALVLYKKPYFNEYSDGVIYFALAGMGFGLPENVLYTLHFGAKAGILRILLTPLLHASITAIAGYYLVSLKIKGKSPFLVVLPLILLIILHAFYDFGLASGIAGFALLSILITLGLSISLFMVYVYATEKDQTLGLSAVGHNSFCRACGFPNPKHYLYCVHCGKNA